MSCRFFVILQGTPGERGQDGIPGDPVSDIVLFLTLIKKRQVFKCFSPPLGQNSELRRVVS